MMLGPNGKENILKLLLYTKKNKNNSLAKMAKFVGLTLCNFQLAIKKPFLCDYMWAWPILLVTQFFSLFYIIGTLIA
jgi:hypothetical protein